LVDPATLFDLVKIRRLVDDATDLAVRAANGTTSSALVNSQNASNGLFGGGSAAALGLGLGGGVANAKLSKERKHRMREHATQKLSHAYHLDEIAASVATMQSASALEEVAKYVLTRNRDDPDATYVHFFHEKIPSRSLAECTSLAPLDEVIRQRPTDGAPYRTRAVTRIFKEDFTGATTDLTEGLRVCRMYNTQHERRNEQTELVLAREAAREQRTDARVDEKDQPSSLEGQLLFHRAGTYLTMACENIAAALHGLTANNRDASGDRSSEHEGKNSPTIADKETNHRRFEARKLVRTYAKRALRDYTAFIGRFDYTPGQPAEITKAFLAKVNAAANGHGRRGQESRLLEMAEFPMTARSSALVRRNGHSPTHPRRQAPTIPLPSKPVYSLNELFAAVPPSSLPPYPVESTALVKSNHNHNTYSMDNDPDFSETLTYHPLLTDALHSLLLTHTLIQTSPKELLRHAHMVARLTRLTDGFPIFLAARSPARADWVEVMRRTHNFLHLSASWDTLCTPAPLPGQEEPKPESAEQRRERSRREAIREALADERVVDEETFRRSVRAREERAAREEEEEIRREYLRTNPMSKPGLGRGDGERDGREGVDGKTDGNADSKADRLKRWAQEEGKEYPITTERAEAIARWIREAPQPGEGGAGADAGARKGGLGKKAGRLRKSASNVSSVNGNCDGNGTGLEKSVEILSVAATEG
jgi:hypothetical protein